MSLRNKLIPLAAAAFFAIQTTPLQATERTGGQFHELIQEMNDEISQARTKIDKINLARQQNIPKTSTKILKERRQKLKQLDLAVQTMNKAKTEKERRDFSMKVEEQITGLSEVSASYLQRMKAGLISEDKQMALMSDVLSGIIYKLDKLDELAKSKSIRKDKDKVAKEKKQIKSMANMVDMLSLNIPNSKRWNGVRKTLVMQNRLLKQSQITGDKLRQRLKTQKEAYQQALAQVAIARQKIIGDKQTLAQIALGEIAQGSLRRAAALLVGSMNIESLGPKMIEKSEARQASLVEFLDQTETTTSLDVSESVSDETPSGWDELTK